ncbi:putative aldouronate transport system permease protein [Clostridium grantii DSM 8605]|uniref:Putative aldouronate transport system permease protein n=1 Tax=Clostridium grantii DSM 8605 TaxID=1121316 RepID=A0A1M5XSU8_9CLOT|nr:carbohydrate ABC transporter permease [Clostridium grantii]SHI02588.1 putative aldouronate transport system permease protein [Clostridium grantii DSM 8605]
MVENNKVQQLLLNIVMTILGLSCVIPFMLLIISSFSSEASLVTKGYSLFPKEFSLETYSYICKSISSLMKGYGLTILVTVVGTMSSIALTVLFAYPLSRKELPFRNFFALFIFFTMLFNGGIVPTYLMYVNTFSIKNTLWAYIVPGHLLGAFYVIMMRSYFASSIPDSLVEAARLDGCGEFRILRSIILPLSKPMLATLTLMIGLTYWNDWVNGLYYITDPSKYTIQMILNTMLMDIRFLSTTASSLGVDVGDMKLPTVGIRMGIAVAAVIPILIIYPFLQKYFVKGIAVGGVKG